MYQISLKKALLKPSGPKVSQKRSTLITYILPLSLIIRLFCVFSAFFYKTSFKFQCTLIISLPLYPYVAYFSTIYNNTL